MNAVLRAASSDRDHFKAQRVLVRYFPRPRLDTCLRITIGTESEMESFFQATERLLAWPSFQRPMSARSYPTP